MMEDPHEDESLTIFPLPLWAVLLCAVILLVPGCSTIEQVPVCTPYGYTPAQMNGEPGVFLDGEDIENLHNVIMGLSQGKCRLPSPGQDA